MHKEASKQASKCISAPKNAQMHRRSQTCSCAQMLKCSNAPMLQCSNAQMLKCSNAQVLKCSNAQMLECSILLLPPCLCVLRERVVGIGFDVELVECFTLNAEGQIPRMPSARMRNNANVECRMPIDRLPNAKFQIPNPKFQFPNAKCPRA